MKLKHLFLIFALLLAPSLFAQGGYEEMRVARITIVGEGDAAVNGQEIRNQMATKIGHLFSQAEFDQDLKRLSEDYDRVEPEIEARGRELYITLRIWMKPTIRSITFCGNERVKSKRLMKELEIVTGTVYERDEFLRAFNKLKILYVKKGYFEAQLDYQVLPVEGCNEVDIQVLINEGRSGKIKDIRFCGFTKAEQNEVLSNMVSRKYNFFIGWYTGRGTYNEEMIDHDRLQILNFLHNQGYSDAAVDICIEERPGGGINVVITADKGQRYYFGIIKVCGNTLFENFRIGNQLRFGKGNPYSPEKLRESVQGIQDLYGSKGYIDAAVDIQLSLRSDRPVYDVTLNIDQGEQYRVGLIRVFGNRCTQPRVILHESLLCPGDVFDTRRLSATEARLGNTGYFSNVNVYAVGSPQEDECGVPYRDIYIEVEETDTGNLGLFFGFSSLDRLFGGVEVTERNFNWAGIFSLLQRGPMALRGGGEFLNLKANIGDRQTTYRAQWTKPYFMDTPWIVGFDVDRNNNRINSKAYEMKSWGGSVNATYITNDYLKWGVRYRARHTNTSVRDNTNKALVRAGDNRGFISAISGSMFYDSTDNPRCPTHGLRSIFTYELAGLGGNFDFMKFIYHNSYYYPLWKRGTLKFRADADFMHMWNGQKPRDLPLSERIYLGGETTVRGYRPSIIGPKFGNNEPAGGVSAYLLSEEYQHNLFPCFDAFAFVDAGYVSLSEFTVGQPAVSVGLGLRVSAIASMPFSIGWGVPIHPVEKRDGRRFNNAQRFFFSMGGFF